FGRGAGGRRGLCPGDESSQQRAHGGHHDRGPGSVEGAPLGTQHAFVASTILGCNLGPNLTTVGSLATVLWLLILRQRNIDVSGLDYFKVGLLVTPLMLLGGALTKWLLLR